MTSGKNLLKNSINSLDVLIWLKFVNGMNNVTVHDLSWFGSAIIMNFPRGQMCKKLTSIWNWNGVLQQKNREIDQQWNVVDEFWTMLHGADWIVQCILGHPWVGCIIRYSHGRCTFDWNQNLASGSCDAALYWTLHHNQLSNPRLPFQFHPFFHCFALNSMNFMSFKISNFLYIKSNHLHLLMKC